MSKSDVKGPSPLLVRGLLAGAPGRIRTCAPASGAGDCSRLIAWSQACRPCIVTAQTCLRQAIIRLAVKMSPSTRPTAVRLTVEYQMAVSNAASHWPGEMRRL